MRWCGRSTRIPMVRPMPDEIESAVVERTEMLFESHLRFAVQLPLAAHAACRWDRSALDRSVGLQCGAEFCPLWCLRR